MRRTRMIVTVMAIVMKLCELKSDKLHWKFSAYQLPAIQLTGRWIGRAAIAILEIGNDALVVEAVMVMAAPLARIAVIVIVVIALFLK